MGRFLKWAMIAVVQAYALGAAALAAWSAPRLR